MDDDHLTGRIQAFVNCMHSVTLSLVRIDPSTRQPILLQDPKAGHLIASGFAIIRGSERILLSAGHALGAGSWALETRVSLRKEREVLLFALGRTQSSQDGDLGWVRLDWPSMSRNFVADARTRGKSLEIPFYAGPLDSRPVVGEAYGFAASNNATLVRRLDNPDLWREGCYEVGMEFDGCAPDGRYRFKLARTHQGHEYYCGASGAPIADPEGRIVSIVSGGNRESNLILGTPLAELIHEVVDAT